MSPLQRRVEAVEATIARFKDRPLSYGRDDCARMAAFCLRRLGVKAPLLKGGSYSSKLGAARALKAIGAETLADAVDGVGLPRIAPAMCLPGDILALPAHDETVALMIAVGNGRAFGYFDGKFQVGQPLLYVAAWRSIDG
jgi:hypothetical protein